MNAAEEHAKSMALPDADLHRYGWAPGFYTCRCYTCNGEHVADKRAVRCRECAAGLHYLTGGVK